jgi:hypothetical protein
MGWKEQSGSVASWGGDMAFLLCWLNTDVLSPDTARVGAKFPAAPPNCQSVPRKFSPVPPRKRPAPHKRWIAPQKSQTAPPNFSAVPLNFRITPQTCRTVPRKCPGIPPNFCAAPPKTCGIPQKRRAFAADLQATVPRQLTLTQPPSPVLLNTLSHRMGEGRGEGRFSLKTNSKLKTIN